MSDAQRPVFVGERISPQSGSADIAAMSRGEPGLPGAFHWRGQRFEVARRLSSRRDMGQDRGDTYIRRHVHEFETADGLRMSAIPGTDSGGGVLWMRKANAGSPGDMALIDQVFDVGIPGYQFLQNYVAQLQARKANPWTAKTAAERLRITGPWTVFPGVRPWHAAPMDTYTDVTVPRPPAAGPEMEALSASTRTSPGKASSTRAVWVPAHLR